MAKDETEDRSEAFAQRVIDVLIDGMLTLGRLGRAFALPPAHAAWLTRAAGQDNLAVPAQHVGLLAQVEDQVVDCFRRGGGVTCAAFPRFTALLVEDSRAVGVGGGMPTTTLPRVRPVSASRWAAAMSSRSTVVCDGPEITDVRGQTGGLIEASCLPSHPDLRPVGFHEVWHRR